MSFHSRLRRRSCALALCWTALLACVPCGTHAEGGPLRVAAVVARRASIAIDPPRTVTLAAADVARGWLQVDTPVEVVVRSNVPEGYALAFQQYGEALGEVQVLGMDAPVVLAHGQAMAARRAPGTGYWTDRVMLRFRFALQPGTQPGEVPWPVQISLLPR